VKQCVEPSTEGTIGRFLLPEGFPDEYYAFTDGQISAIVEKYGGINTISYIDVLQKDGKQYPYRGEPAPLFRKEGNRCGKRPLYGPALQFISTTKFPDGSAGRHLFHTPDEVALYPFGFRSSSSRLGCSTSYDMAIIGRDILFSFTNEDPDRDELIISINKDHILGRDADALSKEQEPGETGRSEKRIKRGQAWEVVGFDSDVNGFVMRGTLRFPYGDKGIFVLFAADRSVRCSETKCRYLLGVPWGTVGRIKMCLAIAEGREEALARSKAVLADFDAIFSRKLEESVAYSNAATRLYAEDRDAVGLFSTTAPSFLRAMVMAETDKEACIRAATHKFGYFISWDQLWPARAFLLMGDWELAKKLLRYHVTFPGTEQDAATIPLIITLLEDVLAISGDADFLKETYTDVKRLFLAQMSRVSSSGLLETSCTFGVDDPKEIGMSGEMWAPDVNGWWYAACRAFENMAIMAGDEETQHLARALVMKLQENYLPTFYDESTGYLFASVDPKGAKGLRFYQNVSTMAMDTPYGESLLHPRIDEIARFQAHQLYHPAGRSAVAYWDNAHEMWKNCIMYQHIPHEMKTARAADRGDEIERMMDVYLGHFSRNKVAIETHNLVGAEGDITQRANWQAFGARALYSGIVEGLMGIQPDLGGFCYAPCDMSRRMSISEWRFRDGRWHIEINGKGSYVKKMLLDGAEICGTLKIPVRYYTGGGSHELFIERGEAPFQRPTLLSAPGAAVRDVHSDESALCFDVADKVHTTCKIYSPFRPRVTIGGREVPFEWDERKNLAWVDALMEAGAKLEISR